MKQDFFRVGVIASTHGIKGEVKIHPTTDDISRFDFLKTVILDAKGGQRTLEVEGVKYFKGMPILKFNGIDKIEDIEGYKGCDLLVSREDAVPLEEGEHYIADLLGLDVITDDGEKLGTVKDVLQTGANDVYVVAREGLKDLLIPSIPDCILEVNIEENYVKVRVTESLLEIYK